MKLLWYLSLSVLAVWLPESSLMASPINDVILIVTVAVALVVYNRIQSIRARIED
jgi:hypothetical protein